MPFLLAEILNFQGSTHHIGVGSFSYLHINNVNILLEIIARYVIELLNPELKNVVERRTVFYKERYKQLLEKNK